VIINELSKPLAFFISIIFHLRNLSYIYDMFHVGYITYLSWLRRDPDYSAYIKRLKAERRADMEARKAERMKNPRRARRTPAQHRVRKVS